MKRKIVSLIILLGLFASIPAMIIKMQDEKQRGIITESGDFGEQDYLFLGRNLTFTGTAEDLIFLGERLTFSGQTALTLIAFCQQLTFTGVAGNGIISAGMNILLDGKVNDNSFFACQTLELTEQATVSGDLFAGCQKLIINGKIDGDLHVGAREVIINGVVDGNVKAYAGRISIGENGSITGNLSYSSQKQLNDQEKSRVEGKVTYDQKQSQKQGGNWWVWQLVIGIGFFISFLVVGLLLLIIPAFRALDAPQPARSFWRTGLWGLIPVLIYPALVMLSFVLIFTIPFAFVLLLAAVPLLYLSYLIGTVLLGKYLAGLFRWNIANRFSQFLIGALAALLLSIIPFINFLAFLFISAAGWGVFLSFLFRTDLTGMRESGSAQ